MAQKAHGIIIPKGRLVLTDSLPSCHVTFTCDILKFDGPVLPLLVVAFIIIFSLEDDVCTL